MRRRRTSGLTYRGMLDPPESAIARDQDAAEHEHGVASVDARQAVITRLIEKGMVHGAMVGACEDRAQRHPAARMSSVQTVPRYYAKRQECGLDGLDVRGGYGSCDVEGPSEDEDAVPVARTRSVCENRGVKEGAVMKRDDVLRILAAHRDDFVAMGVRELAIFGSVARDEAGAGSDVDVLVDYEPGTRLSYFRVFELRERLEELLDAKVDLVTMGGLRQELREGILAEAIRAA